jgi:hypothetical protein
MKVLLDKFKVWAQGGDGRGGEEALKQQVEAAVEGYKHQLQVPLQTLLMIEVSLLTSVAGAA